MREVHSAAGGMQESHSPAPDALLMNDVTELSGFFFFVFVFFSVVGFYFLLLFLPYLISLGDRDFFFFFLINLFMIYILVTDMTVTVSSLKPTRIIYVQ